MKFFTFATLFFLFSLFFIQGSVTTSCSSAAAPIELEAPTADLEGGSTSVAFVCDTVEGAPEGAIVRVTNVQTGEIFEEELAADGSFSIRVNMTVGEQITIQIFDSEEEAISEAQTVSRDVDDRTDRCPDPTNAG